MAKSGAQAQAEKPEAQKGSVTKMPIFLTKFDGSGSDNTDEFRRTLIGHIELQPVAANFYKALLKGELSCTAQCLVDHEPRKNDPEAFKAALELHGPSNFRRALELGKAPKRSAAEVTPFERCNTASRRRPRSAATTRAPSSWLRSPVSTGAPSGTSSCTPLPSAT